MAVREGLWDCQYCGTMGILGRHKVCPNCARSRPAGTRFYLPEEAEVVESDKLKEQARIGPDWICAFCASSNPANLDVCRHCNAPREALSEQQLVQEFAPGGAPKSGDMTVADAHEAHRQPPPPKARPAWLLPLIGIAILLACLVGGMMLFGSDPLEASVEQFQWQRTVTVETLQTVVEEDWELPQGARLISQREDVHHFNPVVVGHETRQRTVSEQVQVGERTYVCGQRDLGNGFFEDIECSEPVYETQQRVEEYEEPIVQQVPVYATKYEYEVDRWVAARTERATGNDNQPFWPELSLRAGEREGPREEAYSIVFRDGEGRRYELSFPYEEWLTFESRGSYTLRVNSLGQATGVER